MSFHFSSPNDQTTYLSLTGMIKNNQGLFKTLKQSNYLFGLYQKTREFDTVDSVKKFFGIDLVEGQCIVEVNAAMRWAEYGTRSWRPVCWMFVVDKYGIVAQYKLGYTGDTASGTSPDPKKTKQVWQRSCEVKEFEVPVDEAKTPSEWISNKGRRIDIVGTVKKIRTFSRPAFHYYDDGVGYMTLIMAGNDQVIYWGKLADVNEGDAVKVRATIKDHSIKDGIKQTVINRPALIKDKQEELV